MYSIAEYALVKADTLPQGYRIVQKTADVYILFDDTQEATNAVNTLLNSGVEIFDTETDFRSRYPLQIISFEESKMQALSYWEENIPEHLWTEEIKKLVNQKRQRNNKL